MDIDKMVNHKIAKLSGIIKRQIYQIISEEGLDITPEQWVILVYLWENDGQTIGDLVTQSQKDFANVTRIVEKLSKNGYIKYALKNTLYLQSVYSIKLYLYLLENRFRSTWKIELDCLKGIFECTSDYYNDFRRFNSKILKTSIDEINEMEHLGKCDHRG